MHSSISATENIAVSKDSQIPCVFENHEYYLTVCYLEEKSNTHGMDINPYIKTYQCQFSEAITMHI